jgi:hypothetical protein
VCAGGVAARVDAAMVGFAPQLPGALGLAGVW